MEISSKANEFTWDSVKESASRIENMTSDEILECQLACETLRQKLGDEILFLGSGHPLGIKITCNKVAWTHRWLTWFSKELNRIQSFVGFDALIHAIKQPDKFYDAVTSIEIAELFQWTDDGDIQFERNLKTGVKQSDLTLIFGLDKIFIEHSTCMPSEQETKSTDSSTALMMAIMRDKPRETHHSGRVYRHFVRPKLEKVINAFTECMRAAERDGFCEISKDTWYEFAACNSSELKRLKSWAEQRRLEVDGFAGSGYPDSELNRVRVKLRKKANGGQIPKNSSGIVVIRNNRLFWKGESVIEEIVSSLEEEIYEYHNLVAVVIFGLVPRRESGVFSISDSQVSFRNKSIFNTECAIFIPNKYRESVLPDSITSELTESFDISSVERSNTKSSRVYKEGHSGTVVT